MKGRQIRYSAEEMGWLEANRVMVISDYHREFSAAFGRDDVALVNLHALRKRKGWRTGRTGCFEKGQAPVNKSVPCPPGKGGRHPNARATQFKKGELPHNTRHLGYERIDATDGYVYVSVAEPNPHTGYERRFVLKHLHVWEQANGKLPEGYCLKCLSDDRTNCDPENWEPIPRALLPRLNGGNRYRDVMAFDSAPAELKPAILAVARLDHCVRELRKGVRA